MQPSTRALCFAKSAFLARSQSFRPSFTSLVTTPLVSRPRYIRATVSKVHMSSSISAKTSTDSPSKTFKIALCQTPVTPDKQKNIEVARDHLLRARDAGAQLAVLPECFNCPYDTACFREYAEKLPDVGFKGTEDHSSPSLKMLQQAAQETKMFIVGGSVPEASSDGNIYNCSISVSPEGTVMAKHRKAHLFDIDVPGGIRFKESDVLSAGGSATAFSAPELNCVVGVGICYDVRFPELAMLQARQLGAKLLVFPGAFNMTTGPAHWELLLRARALDNQVFVAACSPSRSASGEGYTAWGHSMVVDPWGTVLASADEKPAVIVTTVDLERLGTVRKSIPTSQQRRQDIYKLDFAS